MRGGASGEWQGSVQGSRGSSVESKSCGSARVRSSLILCHRPTTTDPHTRISHFCHTWITPDTTRRGIVAACGFSPGPSVRPSPPRRFSPIAAAACADWPRGALARNYGDPVRADVPAFLLSGNVMRIPDFFTSAPPPARPPGLTDLAHIRHEKPIRVGAHGDIMSQR
jgi:hypothetical protein